MVTAGILTGCDGCDDGFGPQMVRYTGAATNNGDIYRLEITENLNRAIYAPVTGDNYKLTLMTGNKTSTGTITVTNNGSITLNPGNSSTGTITITISGDGISAITVSGTVTYNDNSPITAVTGGLTPVVVGGSGFEGIWTATLTNQEDPSLTAHYKMVAAKGSWIGYQDGEATDKGTYTVSGRNVTMTVTHEYKNNAWVSHPTESVTGTISGNRLNFDEITLTRQL
jgi:hypothetical protein